MFLSKNKMLCYFKKCESLYNSRLFHIIIVAFILLVCVSCKKKLAENTVVKGVIFGTYYKVTYNSEVNYKPQFDSLFQVINNSMSTYQSDSDISKLNRNEATEIDIHFERVFTTSKDIYKQTEGAFDPTIGAIVNAWDFGPEGKIAKLDSLKIDSLMASVGLNKVLMPTSKKLEKQNPNTFLDFNAIAKGYAVDVIAEYLKTKNINNYLVDIGGEIYAKGINFEKEKPWKVGVEDPHFDGTQSLNRIVMLKDEAMATSGTYRKFKLDENGNRYAHIIDTKTGYPSKTNLLSISVIAENCMTADAYATAFKAMGIDAVKVFLNTHPELKVYLIFENANNEFETLALNGFPE